MFVYISGRARSLGAVAGALHASIVCLKALGSSLGLSAPGAEKSRNKYI
jgi:hypothetical protein